MVETSMPTGAPETVREELAERLAGYRLVREEIERSILPVATSVDGVAFEFQTSLHGLALRRGGYVALKKDGQQHLGQITDLAVATTTTSGDGIGGARSSIEVRLARGTGVVLHGERTPFHDATVRPATQEEVGSWLGTVRPGRAGLNVGELLLAPGVAATLDSGGFNRHTFMCGQSGSGKTYSLGVVLERLLAETTLRVVILDPNSDYVGLGRIREGADAELAARYSDVPGEVAVWRNDDAAAHPLRLRFADLDAPAQAAVLGLDPIRDRDEYAVLVDLLRAQVAGRPLISSADQLLQAETPGARELGKRATNLGVLDWSLWAAGQASLVDELREPTSRCTVVDLGSLDTPQEQRVVAEAVLSTLWADRTSRRPCLVVIDEAHNICPAEPGDALAQLSAERAVQIAAEGRKYGLYLLTSTQRPHKVHENVVSQCDNLMLMRMNSQADLQDLGRLLSFVPPGLMAGSSSFRMGEALVAGKLVPQAMYVQMGTRVSEEGGSDVPVTWASPRP